MKRNFFLSLGAGGLFILGAVPSPLRAADPTPLPAPDNTAAVVSKVNALYFNYKTLGLRKFKCEVKISMFDRVLETLKSQAKEDDPRLKALKDLRFFMAYDEKQGFKFSYTGYQPTGDPKIDNSVMKVINGGEGIVGGFWKSWSAMAFEPALDSAKNTITVKKTGKGYEFTEKQEKGMAVNITDDDFLMTEVDAYKVDDPHVAASVKPVFLKTPQGWLIQSADVAIPQTMTESLAIDYQQVQKYPMPSKADVAIDMLGNIKTTVILQFSQYQLN